MSTTVNPQSPRPERDRLPIDRNRPFTERDYPRKPSEYRPLDHFVDRFKTPEYFLTDEVVRAAITDGDLRDNGDGCACFRIEWGDGVAYYIIAGFHRKGYRVMVTGWPEVHDRDAALDSGLWSADDLDTIESRKDRKNYIN